MKEKFIFEKVLSRGESCPPHVGGSFLPKTTKVLALKLSKDFDFLKSKIENNFQERQRLIKQR
jgi:hypothetical protein